VKRKPHIPSLNLGARSRGWRWRSWLRTTHTYLSLFGMVLMLFFGLTGFAMNHEDWLLPDETEETILGQLPPELLVEPSQPVIVQLLRSQYGASGSLSKFEMDGNELKIRLRKPGQSYDVLVFRDDGFMMIESDTGGVLNALAEVHQGKRSGSLGGLLIDVAALVLVLAAATGMTLWMTVPRRRALGITALAISLLLFLSFYWYVVA
jgi:hypothetical protein